MRSRSRSVTRLLTSSPFSLPTASAPTVEEPPTVVSMASTSSSSLTSATIPSSKSGRTSRYSSVARAKTPTYDDPTKAARSKALLGVFRFDDRLAFLLEPGGADAKLARGLLATARPDGLVDRG